MGRPRSLNKQQVQELVAEANRGIPPVEVGRHFGVSSETVRRIVSGRSYADLSGIRTSEHDPMACADCQEEAIRDSNVARAEAMTGDFQCGSCHQEAPISVVAVLKSRGRVRCSECKRRRK